MKPNATLYAGQTPDYLADVIELTGLTRREIAQAIGITPRMLRYYIKGEWRIPYYVMYAIESLVPESASTAGDPTEELE